MNARSRERLARTCLPWLLLFVAACPASATKGNTNGGASEGPPNYDDYTLQDACAASCEAQAATSCPKAFPASVCTEDCLELQGQLHCPTAWRDLNACMAMAPLFCDGTGAPAVSVDDCGAEIDAFTQCN